MQQPWSYIIAGICFCIAGIFLFQRNAFEEHKKIHMPLLLIVAGIILVSIGTAKRLHLIE